MIQRFGGSLNVNIHFHILFIDGAYELGEQKAPTDFWTANPTTIKELKAVLEQIGWHKLRKSGTAEKFASKINDTGGNAKLIEVESAM